MDNTRNSLGSGSTLLGGAGPAMAAMGSPGGISSMQMQSTPASAIYNPDVQMNPAPPMPNPTNPMMPPNPQGFAMSQQQQMPTQGLETKKPPTEAELLIGALNGRLKSLSAMHESMVIPQQPQLNSA